MKHGSLRAALCYWVADLAEDARIEGTTPTRKELYEEALRQIVFDAITEALLDPNVVAFLTADPTGYGYDPEYDGGHFFENWTKEWQDG